MRARGTVRPNRRVQPQCLQNEVLWDPVAAGGRISFVCLHGSRRLDVGGGIAAASIQPSVEIVGRVDDAASNLDEYRSAADTAELIQVRLADAAVVGSLACR